MDPFRNFLKFGLYTKDVSICIVIIKKIIFFNIIFPFFRKLTN